MQSVCASQSSRSQLLSLCLLFPTPGQGYHQAESRVSCPRDSLPFSFLWLLKVLRSVVLLDTYSHSSCFPLYTKASLSCVNPWAVSPGCFAGPSLAWSLASKRCDWSWTHLSSCSFYCQCDQVNGQRCLPHTQNESLTNRPALAPPSSYGPSFLYMELIYRCVMHEFVSQRDTVFSFPLALTRAGALPYAVCCCWLLSLYLTQARVLGCPSTVPPHAQM